MKLYISMTLYIYCEVNALIDILALTVVGRSLASSVQQATRAVGTTTSIVLLIWVARYSSLLYVKCSTAHGLAYKD